jgi:hypothetical protein
VKNLLPVECGFCHGNTGFNTEVKYQRQVIISVLVKFEALNVIRKQTSNGWKKADSQRSPYRKKTPM